MSPFEYPGDDAGGGGGGSAAIGWTLVGKVLDAGDYALSLELACTTPGTGSVTGSLRYTNADGEQTVEVLTLPLDEAGSDQAHVVTRLEAGTDVEYSTSLSGTGGSEVYSALPLLRPLFLPRFSGLALELFDGADTTKRLRFDLSSIPTGTTITIEPPAASGRLALYSEIPTPAPAMVVALAPEEASAAAQAYPVGAAFLSFVLADPAPQLGYGTWEYVQAVRLGLDGDPIHVWKRTA